MIETLPKLPAISEEERTPLVVQLLEVIHYQAEFIQKLKDEIAILKGHKPRPKIQPSILEKPDKKPDDQPPDEKPLDEKRPGSEKQSKTKNLIIHEVMPSIRPKDIPEGSTFKGYKPFVVQGILLQPYNRLYRLERWKTPDGSYIEGELPPHIKGHFDPLLISYIQYQYFQCHVTQPLLLEELHEFGIDISSGQINRILVEDNDPFHDEKKEILVTGLKISPYIQVDDTGARHKGNNGVCTYIGNDVFAWFASTESKSRINFLTLLGGGNSTYILNDYALEYMKVQKLSQKELEVLKICGQKTIHSLEEWSIILTILGIKNARHIRVATEGALIGGLIENGINPELAVLSDDAGQFNILVHALCWVHADRTIQKLIPFTDQQRLALDSTQEKIQQLYKDLKAYKNNPTEEKKSELDRRFDTIFQENTCFITLNQALHRLYKNKAELLLVLSRPEIPLHNNTGESDIREYAKRRKVSGGTRSDLGRKSRDTFTSLKKTCRKLKVSFWQYLIDRNGKYNKIPRLSELMRKKVFDSP